jgi:hypothetical protein
VAPPPPPAIMTALACSMLAVNIPV